MVSLYFGVIESRPIHYDRLRRRSQRRTLFCVIRVNLRPKYACRQREKKVGSSTLVPSYRKSLYSCSRCDGRGVRFERMAQAIERCFRNSDHVFCRFHPSSCCKNTRHPMNELCVTNEWRRALFSMRHRTNTYRSPRIWVLDCLNFVQ